MASTVDYRYPRIEGEFESEAEASRQAELEDESEYELEDEYEEEAEDEYEDEDEDEAFLGGIARTLGGLLGENEAEFEFESEAESEDEGEFEDEAFANPMRRLYPDAELMAHLSGQAARSESEEEAEAFIGALIPLAARLIPRAATLIQRNAPTLIRGATRLAGQLRGQPRTRRLISALPVVLQRTAQSLADQAAAGRAISPAAALDTLGTIAQAVLSDPADCRRAISAVRTFDRRYHRRHRGTAHAPTGPRTASSRPRRRPSPIPAARRDRRRR
jgi:hypothetical protein